MRLGFAAALAIGFATACSCGRTTLLGVSSEEPDGGAEVDGGGSGGQAGSGGTANGGTSGSGGTGGTGTDAGPADLCKLTTPTPLTPEEIERDNLIRNFCTGCTSETQGRFSAALAGCSDEDRVRACMIDSYTDYYAVVTTPECDALWRAAASCMGQAGSCVTPPSIILFAEGDAPKPCDAEKEALGVCWNQVNGWVTGSRGGCNYGPVDGQCYVFCGGGDLGFEGKCVGAPGLPLSCLCYLNGHAIWDDAAGRGVQFLAADCHDAALRMVGGTCLENVDCCFSWPGPETPPQQHCSCTSDPRQLGHETCEAAAAARDGQVVNLCPQYVDQPSCLNPSDAGCLNW